MRRLAFLLVLFAAPAGAATHTQIQGAIDNFWTNHSAKFIGVQNDYASAHGGKFWQGIVTPAVCPDDGAVANPDLTLRPTDQIERWIDVFTGGRALPNANWPACVRIDVYDGPQGKGWTITVTYTKAGEMWSRTINTGPETWRDRPWERVQ